jgi:hypothetical protein
MWSSYSNSRNRAYKDSSFILENDKQRCFYHSGQHALITYNRSEIKLPYESSPIAQTNEGLRLWYCVVRFRGINMGHWRKQEGKWSAPKNPFLSTIFHHKSHCRSIKHEVKPYGQWNGLQSLKPTLDYWRHCINTSDIRIAKYLIEILIRIMKGTHSSIATATPSLLFSKTSTLFMALPDR